MKKTEKIIIFILILAILAFIGSGVYLIKSGRFNWRPAAEISFDSNKPDYAKYESQGFTRDQVDKLFEKIRKSEQNLREKPDNYNDLIMIGSLLKILKEYDLSLSYYQKALNAKPELGVAYGEIADLYIHPYGRLAEAADYLQKAIERMPYRVDYYRWLADLYVSKFPEKKGEVEGLMLAGVKAAPAESGDFYGYLSVFFRNEENLSKALEYAQKCVAADKENQSCQREAQSLLAEINKK